MYLLLNQIRVTSLAITKNELVPLFNLTARVIVHCEVTIFHLRVPPSIVVNIPEPSTFRNSVQGFCI